ncbi:hypothetical protein P5V15_005833 [Pogonomyrmex californicus]
MAVSMMKKTLPFRRTIDLTSSRNGAKIIFSTGDHCGVADNMLKREEVTSNLSVDGWQINGETRKNNYVIIKLATSAIIKHICIDTTHIKQHNLYCPFSLQAGKLESYFSQDRECRIGNSATLEDLKYFESFDTKSWPFYLKKTQLPSPEMSKQHYIVESNNDIVTHVKLTLCPMGGIARLYIYGYAVYPPLITLSPQFNLVSLLYGAHCVNSTHCFSGDPNLLLLPTPPLHKNDGWMPLDPKEEIKEMMYFRPAVDFRLAYPVKNLSHVIIDTTNIDEICPDFTIQVYGRSSTQYRTIYPLVPKTQVIKHSRQIIPVTENKDCRTLFVELIVSPGGAINRFAIFGESELPDEF